MSENENTAPATAQPTNSTHAEARILDDVRGGPEMHETLDRSYDEATARQERAEPPRMPALKAAPGATVDIGEAIEKTAAWLELPEAERRLYSDAARAAKQRIADAKRTRARPRDGYPA